jgi:hypothetical protein
MDATEVGEREKLDWRQMRRPLPPSRLYGQTAEWMNTLAEPIRPVELCRRYPRIANDLCALWEFSKMWERYVTDLMSLDTRELPRQGLPGNIPHELIKLTKYRSLKSD